MIYAPHEPGALPVDIVTRIGQIAAAEPKAKAKPFPIKGPDGSLVGSKNKPSGHPPKHERLGLRRKHMKDAKKIAANHDV